MISDARGGHVSPGIYTEEKDVAYSVKSLGITSLGLAGETLIGPAFQPIEITKWGEFVDYFGSTSTEKFKGTGLPKYELPYIAKSYLEESNNLTVCRVLGLSGYKPGSVWTIYAKTSASGSVCSGSVIMSPVVVLRSKASIDHGVGTCVTSEQETIKYEVTNIEIKAYIGSYYTTSCEQITPDKKIYSLSGYVSNGSIVYPYQKDNLSAASASISTEVNKFAIVCTLNDTAHTTETYNVSLNKDDIDYIYNVLPSSPNEGDASIYIESVFENSYEMSKVLCDSVFEIAGYINSGTSQAEGVSGYTNIAIDYERARYKMSGTSGETLTLNLYKDALFNSAVTYNFIKESGCTVSDASAITFNFSSLTVSAGTETDYTEPFRCAMTPWIVSNAIASSEQISLRKLFRFLTISDGNSSNYQVKISIQNIKIDDASFDVVVRDFYDNDESPVILEKFTNCNLKLGDKNFIGLRIGTYDGLYECKSKYVTIELAQEEEDMSKFVPCGFLGYCVPNYGCTDKPMMVYNTSYSSSVKPKRQYFGLTKNTLDTDILDYKGVGAYKEEPASANNGFHLDSILNDATRKDSALSGAKITVDGVEGWTFTAVDAAQPEYQASELGIPRIVSEAYCENTIYETLALRKFTVYPYGGFDGWDVFRTSRTNTDEFNASKYDLDNSNVFSKDHMSKFTDLNPLIELGITGKSNPSDYYAYLGAYNQFRNPNDVDINLLATPGIDWMHNELLVNEVIDVVEDKDDGRGGDCLYIVSAPQYDGETEYTSEDLADERESSDINTSYACTYSPWIKYYDSSDKRYIDLPATKDVVRNMAHTDNTSYPWFAPAGTSRGTVDCVRAYYKTTLADEDTLYEAGINPIKTFAKDGVLVWGNKTMYKEDTPLNRVNVRRLMIRIKKLITSAAKNLLFEQYDDTLESQFKALVDPILADVKSNRGLYDYKIITECTPETRDQHILPAEIKVKPTPTLEYISLTFTIYPESVDFDE